MEIKDREGRSDMREINEDGVKNQTYTSIAGTAVSGSRRRLNKKVFGLLLLLTVLIVCGVWGMHWLTEKKDFNILPQSTRDETAEKNAIQANSELYAGKKIVLDAGHGGFDPGATGFTGTRESDLNLKMAEDLKEELESAGMQVIMIRADEMQLRIQKTRIWQSGGRSMKMGIRMYSSAFI